MRLRHPWGEEGGEGKGTFREVLVQVVGCHVCGFGAKVAVKDAAERGGGVLRTVPGSQRAEVVDDAAAVLHVFPLACMHPPSMYTPIMCARPTCNVCPLALTKNIYIYI